MIKNIIDDLLSSVRGAQAAIVLDGDGESVVQAGSSAVDLKLIGAWKEIHLDHLQEITGRLGLGKVRAVLFSQDEGNILVAPIVDGYCLMLVLSTLADVREAMDNMQSAVIQLKSDIV